MKNLKFQTPNTSNRHLVRAVMEKFGYPIPPVHKRPSEYRVIVERINGFSINNNHINECQKIAKELGVELLINDTSITFKSTIDWTAPQPVEI